jgi:hypothetical protein
MVAGTIERPVEARRATRKGCGQQVPRIGIVDDGRHLRVRPCSAGRKMQKCSNAMDRLPWCHDQPGDQDRPCAHERPYTLSEVAKYEKERSALAGCRVAVLAHPSGVAEIGILAMKSPSRSREDAAAACRRAQGQDGWPA